MAAFIQANGFKRDTLAHLRASKLRPGRLLAAPPFVSLSDAAEETEPFWKGRKATISSGLSAADGTSAAACVRDEWARVRMGGVRGSGGEQPWARQL